MDDSNFNSGYQLEFNQVLTPGNFEYPDTNSFPGSHSMEPLATNQQVTFSSEINDHVPISGHPNGESDTHPIIVPPPPHFDWNPEPPPTPPQGQSRKNSSYWDPNMNTNDLRPGCVPGMAPHFVPSNNEWRQGLFRCREGDIWTVVLTAVFPLVTEFRIARMTSNRISSVFLTVTFLLILLFMTMMIFAYTSDERDPNGISKRVLPILVTICLIHQFVTIFKFRRAIRLFFGIKSSCKQDIALSVFCTQCVLCQMKTELDYQKKSRAMDGNFKILIKHVFRRYKNPFF